ncbi:cysteine protease family C01A [Achlya hypogyna]|uniref:Cysteine protease family C01A n=1 Tax=Achlya hypogyna TaxID=1202772 RepID=A0A1V9YBS0_ACHHY|nr:cysteine protease family C01A [Achlya hypogyna]
MHPIVFTAVATAVVAGGQTIGLENVDLVNEFQEWKESEVGKQAFESGFLPPVSTHGRQEGAESAESIQLQRFQATKEIVAQLNKDYPEAEFSVHNPFALLNETEFAAFVMKSFGQDHRQLRQAPRELTAAQVMASDVDWSSHQCNGPVKHQGECGSCWTFSATTQASFSHCLATGERLDLSQQQLVSCARTAGNGCQGGWPWKALDFIRETGVCMEQEYPYVSGSTKQDGQCYACNKKRLQIGRTVEIQGEGALQAALQSQPVQVVVEAGNNVWKNYKRGVIRQCPGARSDHAVVAVGYGTKDGVQHFKIKNSWGTGWGEGGYMYLQRGVGRNGMCNVAEHPSYPELQSHNGGDIPTARPDDDSIADQCNGCNGCYYPYHGICQSGYDAGNCQLLAPYYGTLWCATATAFESLDRAALVRELNAWKLSDAGQEAFARGFVPSATGRSALETENVLLQRFLDTKREVARLNAEHPDAQFSLQNPFVLLSDTEFAAFVKGSFGDAPFQPREEPASAVEVLAAGSKDWTTHQCSAPVRNQGQCGSCWAFAAVAAAEFGHCLVTNQRLDLSTQQLVSCDASSGYGCQGGWPWKALDTIAKTGLCQASAYPYTSGSTGQNGACQSSCTKTPLRVGASVSIQGEAQLQAALDKQPVVVIVEAGNSVWRNYKSGVVKSCPGAQSDHAVLAVGYSADSFKIKNSWGATWGANGYISLQKGVGGKGMCNVAEHPSYPPLK